MREKQRTCCDAVCVCWVEYVVVLLLLLSQHHHHTTSLIHIHIVYHMNVKHYGYSKFKIPH